MALVAGVDSSTQSCKVVIRDAETGELVRTGRATHPTAPRSTRRPGGDALQEAIAAAGGLDDVEAVAVGAQQHGMVCLDADGEVVRPALLWNDTRSARRRADLIEELGGPRGLGRGGRHGPGRVVHGDQAALAGRATSPTTPPGRRRSACRTTG